MLLALVFNTHILFMPMNSRSLRTLYRPARIGFCIREGNLDDLRRAIKLTHTLWGGRFNPIIPVGTDLTLANNLVELFNVDFLHLTADDPQVRMMAQTLGNTM